MNPKLPTYETAALMLMRWLINGTFRGIVHRHTGRIRAVDNSEGMIAEADTVTELAATEFRPVGEGCGIERKSFRLVDVVPPEPTPPPASAPVPHWICEKCGKLEPSQVENGDVCRVCGGAVMWFEPVADAPKGTPVERWPRLTETERIALRTALARLGPTGAHELEELVERLCALLGEKEKQVKIEDSFRKQWMEDALEQRTRAESAEAVLDKRCADVKRLEADLAAARERIRKWEDDYTVLSDECHAARGREAKLREALRRIETHRPGSDESIIARAALAETTEKE